MKRWLYVLIPAVVLAGLVFWRIGLKREEAAKQQDQREQRRKAPVSVVVAPAALRDIIQTFSSVGSVESPENVKVAPKITGRLNNVSVQVGDRVTRGQVLAQLDPAQVQAQVRQQEAAVAEARSRLAQAQLGQNSTNVGVTTAIRQQEAELYSAEAGYRQVQDSLGAQNAAATANVADAQGRIKNAQAAQDSTEADLRQAEQTYNAQEASAQAAVTDAQGRVANAEASINNGKAAVRSAQANVDNARTRLERVTQLYKQGFIAAQDVDDAKTQVSVQQGAVEVAQAQQNGAEAQRDSAVAQKRSAQEQLDIVRTRGKADIEAARAKVNQAKAGVESAQAQKRSAQQQANLIVTKGKSDLEAARAKVVQGRAAVASARANTAQGPAYRQNLAALAASVEVARAQLRDVQSQLADTVLRSPVDGFVTEKYLDTGSIAAPGSPVVSVQAVRTLWVTVPVPEEQSRKIRFGLPATVTIDSLPGVVYNCRVVQVNAAADPTSRQFVVRAVIDNGNNQVKPGMFARFSIVTDRAIGQVVVPREAVHEGKDGKTVIVVEDGKAKIRPVTTGAGDDKGIAIVSGVKTGDKVVTLSSGRLKEDQEVNTGGGRRGGKDGGGKGGPGGEGGRESAAPGEGSKQGEGADKAGSDATREGSGAAKVGSSTP